MTIQLPPPQYAAHASSPLARYLHSVADSARSKNLPVDALPSLLEGAAALAATLPFDPNEVVTTTPFLGTPVQYTLLDNVLALTSLHFQHSKKPWPSDPKAFGPEYFPELRDPTQTQRINSEYLAAQLTAAGANPWLMNGSTQETVPAAVQTALLLNMPHLLERFLECPHAPTAQEVLSATPNDVPVWEQMAAEDSAEAFAVLVQRGARLSPDMAWEEAMKRAKLPLVEPMVLSLGGPVPAAVAKRIQQAWQERLKTNHLAPEKITRMLAWLTPEAAPVSEATAEIQQRLSTQWGSIPNGSSACAYGYCTNRGAATLNSRGRVDKGPMAGQWTVLASTVMARIRAANDNGAREWSAATMVGGERAQLPGSLRDSIGVEWKPGISLDGVLMLGLMGQALEDEPVSIQRLDQQKKAQQNAMDSFALVAGIEDIQAWCRASAPAAAELTIACLKTPSPKAAHALIKTWHRALTMDLELMEQVPAELRLRLVTALHSRFGLDRSPSVKSYNQVVEAMTDGLNAHGLRQSVLDEPYRRDTALEIALGGSSLLDEKALLDSLSKNKAHFSVSHWERVETWLEAQEKNNTPHFKALNGRVREMILEGRLPEPSTSTAPKPRF